MPAPPLLLDTYPPPALRKGDRATCLYRDADCAVTSWTDAPIPWPRVQVVGQRGGSGLLVDETLLRAIPTESSLALQYWFGVGFRTVWFWRKAFGVTKTGTEGSRRLHAQVVAKGVAGVKAKVWTEAERAVKRTLSKGRKPDRWAGRHWTRAMEARLGTEEDDALAKEWGKTVEGVRVRRTKLGIPSAFDHRRRNPTPRGAAVGA